MRTEWSTGSPTWRPNSFVSKCDDSPTPIDGKKDTWIERHTPGKPVESAHEGCYSRDRFLVKSPGKVPAFSEHVSTP